MEHWFRMQNINCFATRKAKFRSAGCAKLNFNCLTDSNDETVCLKSSEKNRKRIAGPQTKRNGQHGQLDNQTQFQVRLAIRLQLRHTSYPHSHWQVQPV